MASFSRDSNGIYFRAWKEGIRVEKKGRREEKKGKKKKRIGFGGGEEKMGWQRISFGLIRIRLT